MAERTHRAEDGSPQSLGHLDVTKTFAVAFLANKSCRRLLYYPYKLSKTQRQRGLSSIDLSNPFAVHAIDPGRDVIQFGTNRVGMAADNPSYNRRLTTAA